MPLAPRKANSPKPSSVKSAAGKAAQRARNKVKGSGNPGSSGAALSASGYPCLDWATIEDEVEWTADVAGKITQSQMGANGYYSMTIYVPKSYAHSVLSAALAQEGAMCYIRMYTVPVKPFEDAQKAIEEAAAEALGLINTAVEM